MSMVGSVVSSTVKVAVAVAELPHSSVAAKVTVAEPLSPHSSESAVKLLVQVRLVEQLSEAEAATLEANQSFSAWLFSEPSHSTVTSLATMSMVGSVVSSMVKVAVAEAELPHSSVAVKVTVAEPVAPHSSESDVKLLVQVRLVEQLSEAEAPPLEA